MRAPLTDAEAIAFARTEIDKVRNWRDPGKKKRNRTEYVLLELDVAERLLAMAEKHLHGQNAAPEP